MVSLFEFGVNIFENVIIVLFFFMYFGCKFTGIKKVIGFFVSLVLTVALLTYFNSLYLYEGFLGLIFILVHFTYTCILLKGDIYTKLFMSGFVNCIVYCIALLSHLLVSIMFSNLNGQLFGMTIERISLIVISKMILIIACIVLLKLKFNNIARKKNVLLLVTMPVVAQISMVGIMQVFLQHSELKHELLMAVVGVMLVNILTYYVFIKINIDSQKELEIRALKQKNDSDRQYVQEVENLYSKTCNIRHDMTKHLDTISALVDEDKSKAKEYIESVTKNHLNGIRSLVRTDNAFFDAIANVKIAVCERYGIKVRTAIMNNTLNDLSPDEIGIIFGNLFDNAIEAARDTSDKEIKLSVQKQDNRCSILMTNSINKSVLDSNPDLHTTKQDKESHGLGIKNIEKIVKVHDGIIDFFEEENFFGCDILL